MAGPRIACRTSPLVDRKVHLTTEQRLFRDRVSSWRPGAALAAGPCAGGANAGSISGHDIRAAGRSSARRTRRHRTRRRTALKHADNVAARELSAQTWSAPKARAHPIRQTTTPAPASGGGSPPSCSSALPAANAPGSLMLFQVVSIQPSERWMCAEATRRAPRWGQHAEHPATSLHG
jgi:hypothetical protein